MSEAVFVGLPRRLVKLTIDGREFEVAEGSTILDACRRMQIDTPTLCQLDNLTPVNVCRVCVVEVEGSRVLVPACSRKVEAGMKVQTDSDRVRHSRRLVLELLASSVDMSLCSPQVHAWMGRYGATPSRFGDQVATCRGHRRRERERRDRPLVLPAQVERLAAGHGDLQGGTRREKVGDERG